MTRLLRLLTFLSPSLLLLAAGCETESHPRVRRGADQTATAEKDHLALAMESLHQFYETEGGEPKRQALYHLNRWMTTQPEGDAWQRDPLVEQLPRRFREMPEITSLDVRKFAPTDDAEYLGEAYVLRTISQWVSADATRRWSEAKRREAGESGLYADPALNSPEYQLEIARSLFDWTVRQVQLDTMLPYPQVEAAGAGGNNAATNRASPPEQAIPGPGYYYFPYQSLLYGHGDAWLRARIFLLLARQADLTGVMLAVDDRGPGSRANLWCPAVLIDKQLYLFDPALGLPIPGEKPNSIATLAEVRANPELLRRLDVDDDGKKLTYPISAAQLESVAALVDAAPEALSLRMRLLEQRLPHEHAMTLAVAPSEIARQVRDCPGLEDVRVRLWTLPLETWQYRRAFERLSERNPELQRRRFLEQGLYLPYVMRGRYFHGSEDVNPAVVEDELRRMQEVREMSDAGAIDPVAVQRELRRLQQEGEQGELHLAVAEGRKLQLLGRLEPVDEKPGALTFYLGTHGADALIEQIPTSQDAQRRLGIPPLPEGLNPQQRQNVLANFAAQYRMNKQHAGYWIGLAQFDLGNHEASVSWLKDRTLDNAVSVWTEGARYNLGRAYEALGQTEEARKQYYQSKSPQRHGDLLRAQSLRGE